MCIFDVKDYNANKEVDAELKKTKSWGKTPMLKKLINWIIKDWNGFYFITNVAGFVIACFL
jgi:hypothetical protein